MNDGLTHNETFNYATVFSVSPPHFHQQTTEFDMLTKEKKLHVCPE